MHEKGSQVEEAELGTASREQSLEILRQHFGRVSLEELEHLYDTCQQNLDWTSNLLLDSGERLYREVAAEVMAGSMASLLRGGSGLEATWGVQMEVATPRGPEGEEQAVTSGQDSTPGSRGGMAVGGRRGGGRGRVGSEGWAGGGGRTGVST